MYVTESRPSPSMFARYASLPMRIEVRSMLRVEPADGGMGGLVCAEVPVTPSYIKDYTVDGGNPEDWASTFDLSNWGFFFAHDADQTLCGAATVTYDTHGVHMLEGRADLGVLWDIRVHPQDQGRGVGRALFGHVVRWLRARGAATLKIETQNVNVPACRFYRALGCELGGISRFAYHEPELAHETMLLWYYDLRVLPE